MSNAKKIRYTLEMPDKVLVEFVTANDFDTLESKHSALLEQVEELAAALRYVSMPITKPYESLTVDGLLETIKNDDDRAKQALASFEAWKKEGLSE